MSFQEASHGLLAFKERLALVRGFRIPDWAVTDLQLAAGAHANGDEGSGERVRKIERNLRTALEKFLTRSPDHFRGKASGLICELNLDQDIVEGIQASLKELEIEVSCEAGAENFSRRIEAYNSVRQRLASAEKSQIDRNRNLATRPREALSTKQRKRVEENHVAADEQRKQAQVQAEAQRQVRTEEANAVLEAFA